MSINYEQLGLDGLLQIGAGTAHTQLDSVAQQAAANHWSYSRPACRQLALSVMLP